MRLVIVTAGVGLAVAAFLALASERRSEGVAAGPPLDAIDDDSRARLEQVLRDAEAEPGR